MRDTIKSDSFFESRIPKLESLIQKSYSRLQNNEVAPQQIKIYKGNIFSNHLHLAIAKYSAGMEFEEMKLEYSKAVALIAEIWPDDGSEEKPDYLFDWYIKAVWFLSIGLCLNVDLNQVQKVVSVLDKSGRKDWLLSFLIARFNPERQVENSIIFPKPYASLKKAVEETDAVKRSAIVKHYLEKEWYPGHKKAYWFNDHKNKHDIYFGYWSFEAAAVVKIAGIDDSSFRDNEYYPKDIV